MSTDRENGIAAPRGRMRMLAVGALVLCVFAVLLGLGTWQVERLHWKEGLLARIEAEQAMAPVSVSEIDRDLREGEAIEYRPVTASGRFDHAKERHFFATYEGQSGFYIYTPLAMTDGTTVLVNRGFVPYERKEAATRSEGQVAGPVTVVGLARERLDGKPSWVVPDNDPAKNVFYWKDLDAMVETAGVAGPVEPFFIDADRTPNPGGLPVGGVTIIDLPNNHLQYAVTWYGLAAALAGVSIAMLLRGRRRT